MPKLEPCDVCLALFPDRQLQPFGTPYGDLMICPDCYDLMLQTDPHDPDWHHLEDHQP